MQGEEILHGNINMNKKIGLILVALILSSFLITNVSAAQGLADLTKNAIDGIVSIAKPYLQTLLGETSDGTIFVAKLLIFIILLSLVYVILKRSMGEFFGDKTWALWLISIAVPILGIRFLSSEMIYTIALPNSAFAVAVTAGLPFILFFLFVKEFESATLRRISWIFFGVIFLGLYTLRANDLGDSAWIYPLTALLCFIMASMDGTLQRFMARLKLEKRLKIYDTLEYYRREKENKAFWDAYYVLMKEGDNKGAKAVMEKIKANEEQMLKMASGTANKS